MIRWFLFRRNRIAWSKYLHRAIKCVFYINDNHWYYEIQGAYDGKKIGRAGTKYSFFNWEKV